MSPLQDIRNQIDQLDRELLQKLAERFALCMQTRAHKTQSLDTSREEEVRSAWISEAQALGISPDFALAVLDLLLQESKALQNTSSSHS